MHHSQSRWSLCHWGQLLTALLFTIHSHTLVASDFCDSNECNYPVTIQDIGFYAVIAELPEGSTEGRFGFNLDVDIPIDGFFGGTVLAENGQVPAYANFTLAEDSPVNISALDYNGQLNAVNIQVKPTGSDTPIFGPVEQAIVTELTTDTLAAGNYTVEITSLAGAPRTYIGMDISALSITGPISTGGWLDANTGQNYFAFFADSTPLPGNLSTQFGGSFSGGATGMNLAGYLYNPDTDVFDFLFSDTTGSDDTPPPAATSLTLSLIHINDHHSHLEEEDYDLDFNGVETRVKLGGFPRVAAKIKELRDTSVNPLVLHIGDAISGTLYYTLFKGDADVRLMNLVGFDAFVLGNHEFDDGNANLATFLSKAEFPTVTANIDFSASDDLRDAGIEPFIIREIDGQQVAIVGIDTLKTLTSSSPGPELIFKDEVESAREQVAILEAQGINKIILMTHYGYQQDQDLAAQVGGVDVILGGDSHTLLGDFTEFGLTSEGPYPTQVTSPRGEPVCIAQAWQYSYIVGSLSVGFDENGLVTECDGAPIMLIGDSFQQENTDGEREDVSPEVRAEIESIVAASSNIAIVAPDPEVAAALQVYTEQVEEQSLQVIGQAAEDLLHIRIPGTHPSGVELSNGSLIAPLVSDAFFFELTQKNHSPDLVIQNAGGVRTDVSEGPITIETAYTLLPFSNTIYLLEMTGTEVKQVLEDALVNHFDNGGSNGSFPYASQIRYTIERDCPSNQRVTSLEIRDADGNYAPINPDRLYKVGTNSFIASGRDGYTTFATVQETRPGLDTFIDYAMSFVNYTQAQGTLNAPESTGVTYITSGCSGQETSTDASLRLSLIHINDHHSHLEEEDYDLDFNGVETRVKLGGFPRVAAKIKELRDTSVNPLVLHIGDAISGTLYYTLFRGDADVRLMNLVGFDAFVLGNHEFDDGNANLATFLSKAQFPTVTANIDFSVSDDLRDAGIEPFIIREIDGQQVAIVGIDTLKTLTSSSPGPDLVFKDEVESAREQVAILEAQGINKIILMTHYGYQQDQDLAAQVGGVDVILGGDSHSLLGDFTEFGLTSEGPYPTQVTSPRGEPVCIAQAWQYSYIVGSLSVGFDENGLVTECDGAPIMLIGDSFQQENTDGEREDVSPEVRAEIESIVAASSNIAIVAPDPEVAAALQVYTEQVEEQSLQVIGQAADDLLHIRIPGTHPSGVELPNGSLIAPLVSDAFFFELTQKNHSPDLVIQNAGGVRTDVSEGPITIETAYTLLPFSNTIYLLEMTGTEVKQVLEDALVNHFDNGGSNGSFPYASQIRYTIERDCPSNQRVTSLEIRDADGNYAPINRDRLYKVGTNSFIASGRDGYTTFATVQETRPGLDTFIDYAMSFVNYTQAQGTLNAPESTGVTYITGSCSGGGNNAATPEVILRGRAVLPAATFADGPTSGVALGTEPVNEQTVPFVDKQPVQGFSAVLDNDDGSFLVMSDNGFGSMNNSADYHLRVYTIRPDFETASGGSGNIAVESFFELKDPNNLIPFPLTQDSSEERVLTGADFDLESFQQAPDGTFWFGEEFGPFLLHTDANGVLLDAPIPLPDFENPGRELRSPQNPYQEEGDDNPIRVAGSGGFEGMAITPDGSKLITLLEKPLLDSTVNELLMHEFDIASKSYTGVQYRYPLDERGTAIGDFVLFSDSSGLVIERDGSQGDMDGFKRIYRVNLPADGGLVEKVLAVDLLRIQDPDLISLPANDGDVGLGEEFGFPFITIEDVVVLGDNRIGVLNDNNYPFSVGRQVGTGLPDDNEFIILELPAGLLTQ